MRVLSKNDGSESPSDETVTMHDILTAWGQLVLPGMGEGPGRHIGVYADRGLLMPGTTVTPDGPIDDYVRWLWSVGIGAERVLLSRSASPVRDLLQDSSLAGRFLGRCRELRLFDVSEDTERLRQRFGASATFFNPSLDLARQAGNKSWFRRQGAKLGLDDWFLEHRFALPEVESILRAMDEVVESDPKLEFIVLKIPDSASGDGMAHIDHKSSVRRKQVFRYLARPEVVRSKEIIVEAGYKHVPMSILWEISPDGQVKLVSYSQQLIKNGFEHKGNIVSSGQLPDVTDQDVRQMKTVSYAVLGYLVAAGFVGTIGLDFLRPLGTEQVKAIEINPRVTGQSYVATVRDQVAPRWDGDCAVVMSNVVVGQGITSFTDVQRRLNGQLFDGVGGALPFNLRCLGYEQPRCSFCCVAGDVSSAQSVLDEAQQQLA